MDSATQSTSSSLVRLVQRGDGAAWDRFASLYVPLVYHWAKQYRLQESDARDVCQTVFVSVLKNLKVFRGDLPDSTLRGWLRTITRNAVIDFFRKQGRQAPVLDEDHPGWDSLALEESVSKSGGLTERLLLVRRAAEVVRKTVEPTTWAMFEELTVEGRTVEQVATSRNVSVWAVYKARTRVLAKFRDTLGNGL